MPEIKKKEKEDAKKQSEKEIAVDVKKKETGRVPETKQGSSKVAVPDSKKTKKTSEEQPKGKKQEKKEKHTEPAKSPKKDGQAPSEKQVKTKTEQAKEVGTAFTKKALPAKKEEKTTKAVEQGKKK
ncbi:triadin-like [Thomomys bottae]